MVVWYRRLVYGDWEGTVRKVRVVVGRYIGARVSCTGQSSGKAGGPSVGAAQLPFGASRKQVLKSQGFRAGIAQAAIAIGRQLDNG